MNRTIAVDPWENVEIPAAHAIQGRTYPFAQWWNGQKAFQRVHPVLGSGGWAIPVEQLAGIVDTVPWTASELPHKDGSSTEAYLAPELYLAVLATRFAWVMRGQRGLVVLPEYVEGAKGKTQALCAVRGLTLTVPLMVTLSGMASRHFGQVLRAFRQQIIAPATSVARKAFPMYAFWMPVKAGPSVNVGQNGKQSPITPPIAGWDPEQLKDPARRRDILRSLFVGQDVIDFCATHWDESQRWAEAQKPQSTLTVEDPAADIAQELPPPMEEDEIPF